MTTKINSRPPTFPSHTYSSQTSRLALNLETEITHTIVIIDTLQLKSDTFNACTHTDIQQIELKTETFNWQCNLLGLAETVESDKFPQIPFPPGVCCSLEK